MSEGDHIAASSGLPQQSFTSPMRRRHVRPFADEALKKTHTLKECYSRDRETFISPGISLTSNTTPEEAAWSKIGQLSQQYHTVLWIEKDSHLQAYHSPAQNRSLLTTFPQSPGCCSFPRDVELGMVTSHVQRRLNCSRFTNWAPSTIIQVQWEEGMYDLLQMNHSNYHTITQRSFSMQKAQILKQGYRARNRETFYLQAYHLPATLRLSNTASPKQVKFTTFSRFCSFCS